jgi:16S rRNA (cytosine1402-N4)-methyltransferase
LDAAALAAPTLKRKAMSDFRHQPVMLAEVLTAMQPRAGGRYLDGTLGGGGHAAAILARSGPDGWLYGCDRDTQALAAAQARLAEYAGRFELRQGNFADAAQWVGEKCCDGVLYDLGVSSPQLDRSDRGFSFMQDGPLDMRMAQDQALTAAGLVNEASMEELARIFREYGDQPGAWGLARAIVEQRMGRRFTTTKQLADFIERRHPRAGKRSHPATRVFLALRIAVNDELGSLRRGLEGAVRMLRPGGRLCVITFHSAEDRLVKEFGREKSRDYTCPDGVDVPELRQPRVPELRWVQRKAGLPGEAELRENPRSRSAQLRILEKL